MSNLNLQSFIYSGNLLKNRDDAKRKLMEILPLSKMLNENWIVIAISTGGLYLADKIVKPLPNATLELLFTEKVTAPNNRDCEIAIVSESEEIVMNRNLVDSFDINLDYVYGEANRRYEENILQYIYRYRKGETIIPLNNKNILFIDEGVDSGLTMMVSIKTAITMKAKTIAIATPIIPLDLVPVLESMADEVYSLYKVSNFVDTKFYYEELEEIDYSNIQDILDSNSKFRKFRKDKNEL